MDLTNHVILTTEDFRELQYAAFDKPALPKTTGDRIGTAAQTTLVYAGFAATFGAACWAWAKASDYLEEKNFQRRLREKQIKNT